MAEEQDAGERTEAATDKRREEARREGQIPRSAELSTAAVLLGSAFVLSTVGVSFAKAMTALFARGLQTAAFVDEQGTVAALRGMGAEALGSIGVMLAALAAVPLGVAVLQARGILTTSPLAPKGQRINPLANLGRIVGLQGWIGLLKMLIKVAVVGYVLQGAMRTAWPSTLALVQQTPGAFLMVLQTTVLGLLPTAGKVFLALAVLDYGWEWFSHERRLRMTKQQIKEEDKQSSGDPHVRQRQRSVARARLRKSMLSDVKKASVVVTNPSHIAVALRYVENESLAPLVLAVGQRKVAERIKAIAYEMNIPVIENKPLARALFTGAPVGSMIPPEMYQAVAEVLSFVMRTRQNRAAAWSRPAAWSRDDGADDGQDAPDGRTEEFDA